jgi:SAM-dependent methyltransferase
MTDSSVEYVGKDLEAMDFAVAYHRWILDRIRPYLGKDLVEVGAGTGSFSQMLLNTNPVSLTVVEPSQMYDTLRATLTGRDNASDIKYYRDIFSNVSEEIRRAGPPDSILYINVLEHIRDDETELRAARDTLRPGGRVFIFVPAIPMLLSDFDRQIGHFRRYRRNELKAKCERSGFKTLTISWFDMAGILPWLVKYRLLRSLKMESGAVQFYDKLAVPFIRPLENLLHPPIGKNLLYVGERV